MQQLKKVTTTVNQSTIKDIVENEKELNRRLLEADLDSWYDFVKDYTYRTVFVPITVQDAQAMVVRAANQNENEETKEILDDLEKRIAKAIEEVCISGNVQEVFAKLSSRSPKDATNRWAKKKEILLSILNEQLQREKTKTLTKNNIVSCIYQAHISSLKLSSACEVLQTLLASDRVMNDEIPLALEHSKRKWKEHIVIRQWCPIPIKYELRGFVYNNTLTGLCQYYDEVLYPEFLENKDLIQKIVFNLFDEVKHLIPINPKEYVLDIIVDLEHQKALIVEINPFGKPDGMGTGTVMFNLKNETDADILFGKKPFEFRIETVPLSEEKFSEMIGAQFEEVLKGFY